jgi:hypothetical protein
MASLSWTRTTWCHSLRTVVHPRSGIQSSSSNLQADSDTQRSRSLKEDLQPLRTKTEQRRILRRKLKRIQAYWLTWMLLSFKTNARWSNSKKRRWSWRHSGLSLRDSRRPRIRPDRRCTPSRIQCKNGPRTELLVLVLWAELIRKKEHLTRRRTKRGSRS